MDNNTEQLRALKSIRAKLDHGIHDQDWEFVALAHTELVTLLTTPHTVSGEGESMGSPVKYSDGTYSREYEEQPTPPPSSVTEPCQHNSGGPSLANGMVECGDCGMELSPAPDAYAVVEQIRAHLKHCRPAHVTHQIEGLLASLRPATPPSSVTEPAPDAYEAVERALSAASCSSFGFESIPFALNKLADKALAALPSLRPATPTAAPAPTEHGREAFERECIRQGMDITRANDGEYLFASTRAAYKFWQAALTYASTRPQQGEVKINTDLVIPTQAAYQLLADDGALRSQSAPVAQAAPVGEVVERVLMQHTLLHTFVSGTDAGLPLVDRLSPDADTTIENGKEEVAAIADAIASALSAIPGSTRMGEEEAKKRESGALETDLAFKLSKAAEDVFMERKRQVMVEGWTPEHDDEHSKGEMAKAAGCYALFSQAARPSAYWPWAGEWWKPKDKRRNLVRAGALILAEIERLDRALTQPQEAAGGEGE